MMHLVPDSVIAHNEWIQANIAKVQASATTLFATTLFVGIDPAIAMSSKNAAAVGFAIYNRDENTFWLCKIPTLKRVTAAPTKGRAAYEPSMPERVHYVAANLHALLAPMSEISLVVTLEQMYIGSNVGSSMRLANACGAIMSMLFTHKNMIAFYNPNAAEWRGALGVSSSNKGENQQRSQKRAALSWLRNHYQHQPEQLDIIEQIDLANDFDLAEALLMAHYGAAMFGQGDS